MSNRLSFAQILTKKQSSHSPQFPIHFNPDSNRNSRINDQHQPHSLPINNYNDTHIIQSQHCAQLQNCSLSRRSSTNNNNNNNINSNRINYSRTNSSPNCHNFHMNINAKMCETQHYY